MKELFELPSDDARATALAYADFAERTASVIPDIPIGTKPRDVAKAAIIGAGTMGAGIAMALANAGIKVYLYDSSEAGLARGMEQIAKNYSISAARGRISEDDVRLRLGLISAVPTLKSAADADIFIEAVFEDLDLKKSVFAEIDQIARPGAILATNTSGLDIDAIAASTSRPQDVVGAHFFSPANVMRLLEVVRGQKTGLDVIATMMSLALRLRKVAVQSLVSPGFIGNAMLAHYVREAVYLAEEGATPKQIDGALTEFGYAMGMLTVSDMAGLDVGLAQRRREFEATPPGKRYPGLGIELCGRGRLGQKTGAGWYKYVDGDRTPHEDPELTEIVRAYAARQGINQRQVSQSEIIERCMLGVINEGARLVERGVALRPSDVDIVWITGYGFPRWRGGPLFSADRIGLKRIEQRLRELEAQLGPDWTPAPLLVELAATGRGFLDLQSEAQEFYSNRT